MESSPNSAVTELGVSGGMSGRSPNALDGVGNFPMFLGSAARSSCKGKFLNGKSEAWDAMELPDEAAIGALIAVREGDFGMATSEHFASTKVGH